jgi:hypothetical protein
MPHFFLSPIIIEPKSVSKRPIFLTSHEKRSMPAFFAISGNTKEDKMGGSKKAKARKKKKSPAHNSKTVL